MKSAITLINTARSWRRLSSTRRHSSKPGCSSCGIPLDHEPAASCNRAGGEVLLFCCDLCQARHAQRPVVESDWSTMNQDVLQLVGQHMAVTDVLRAVYACQHWRNSLVRGIHRIQLDHGQPGTAEAVRQGQKLLPSVRECVYVLHNERELAQELCALSAWSQLTSLELKDAESFVWTAGKDYWTNWTLLDKRCMTAIGRLTNLERLAIHSPKRTRCESLASYLSGLTKLTHLDLAVIGYDSQGMQGLSHLQHLKELISTADALWDSNTKDFMLLAKLASLTSLTLKDVVVRVYGNPVPGGRCITRLMEAIQQVNGLQQLDMQLKIGAEPRRLGLALQQMHESMTGSRLPVRLSWGGRMELSEDVIEQLAGVTGLNDLHVGFHGGQADNIERLGTLTNLTRLQAEFGIACKPGLGAFTMTLLSRKFTTLCILHFAASCDLLRTDALACLSAMELLEDLSIIARSYMKKRYETRLKLELAVLDVLALQGLLAAQEGEMVGATITWIEEVWGAHVAQAVVAGCCQSGSCTCAGTCRHQVLPGVKPQCQSDSMVTGAGCQSQRNTSPGADIACAEQQSHTGVRGYNNSSSLGAIYPQVSCSISSCVLSLKELVSGPKLDLHALPPNLKKLYAKHLEPVLATEQPQQQPTAGSSSLPYPYEPGSGRYRTVAPIGSRLCAAVPANGNTRALPAALSSVVFVMSSQDAMARAGRVVAAMAQQLPHLKDSSVELCELVLDVRSQKSALHA